MDIFYDNHRFKSIFSIHPIGKSTTLQPQTSMPVRRCKKRLQSIERSYFMYTLVGGLEHLLVFHILGIILPFD